MISFKRSISSALARATISEGQVTLPVLNAVQGGFAIPASPGDDLE
jgi:hypothetical protein